mgnify:CR=1 FL=1
MVYHARIEEKIEGNPLYNPNRHAMLMEIHWMKRQEHRYFLTKINVT